MTTEEFSNEFDSLIAFNIGVQFGEQNPIAFDEYEKSIFLTKAQEDTILSLYSGKNIAQDSFEKTEEMRRTLGTLVKTAKLTTPENNSSGLSDDSKIYLLPDDLWFITYEQATIQNLDFKYNKIRVVQVIPTSQDTYNITSENPFKRNTDKRILRLDLGNNQVELISEYTIQQYLIRYLMKPSPIVLIDLPDGLSINNISIKTECNLHELLHRPVLQKAVQLALASRSTQINNNN